MDMVDSALKRVDVGLSKRGTFLLNGIHLRALRSCFLTQFRGAGLVNFNFKRKMMIFKGIFTPNFI